MNENENVYKECIENIEIKKSQYSYRLSREQKIKILDFLEELCETSRLSKKTLGQTIRSYHVSLPFVVIILLFYGTQLTVTVAAINLFIVFILFFKTM